MSTTREISIIASPRTGTNFFCDTLSVFPGFASLFELFNPRGVFGVERYPNLMNSFSAALGKEVTSSADPDLVKYVSEDRLGFLSFLRAELEVSDVRAFSYKIFPGQMPEDELAQVLTDPRRVYIVVARNRIDTYISYKKAMQSDVWVNSQTDNVAVEVGLDEFMEWAADQDEWYEKAMGTLRAAGQRVIAMSYDSDINVPKPVLVEKQYLALRSLGIDVPFPAEIEPPRFRRQDKVAGPFTKISNGEALKKEFLDRRLLGRYALKSFLVPLAAD